MIQGGDLCPRRMSLLKFPWLFPILNPYELRGLCSRSHFGPRTCGGGVTNVIEVSGLSIRVSPVFCILYSVICLRGNGVIRRTQKVIQGDDNGHVGRPCEVSRAPPCPELFCELRGLCHHSYFGPRTCSRSERPMSSK